MALVNYGSSDESGSDDEQGVQQPPKPATVNGDKNAQATSLANHNQQPSSSSTLSSLNKIVAKKKSGSSLIQISAPSLAELEDTSSDEDEPKHKRSKPSSSGSGLSSLLPKPKSALPTPEFKASTSTVKTSVTQLVPDSIRLKKPTLPPPRVTRSKDDDDDGIEIKSFFSMPSTSNTGEQRPEETAVLPSVEIAPKLDKNPPIVHNMPDVPTASSSTIPVDDDYTLKKKIAARFGDETADQISIMDVNVNDHLYQNKEYLKTISLEQPQEVKGDAPNATAKRKHQITYLAYQAKQRELALKNEWAANKVAKSQTRAKYGF